MKKYLLAAALCLTLAACADEAATSKSAAPAYTVGKTTVADVKADLGQPTKALTTSSGFTTLVYGDKTFVFGADGKLKSLTPAS